MAKTREIPLSAKTRRHVITDGQETLTPFVHAAVDPPFTAVHYPAGWIVQIGDKPDNDAIYRAVKDRGDEPLLLYAETPDGKKFCGAFKVEHATDNFWHDVNRKEWHVSFAQASETPAIWR